MARLEVISSFPVQDCGRPALLFVHGAFTAAWCWREHFLDYFAAAGWASYALSLSGHGGSSSARPLDRLGITDYVADLASTVAALTRPLVLVGHSMGGFVVQKYLERQPPQDAVRGAVLLASVPPQGLMAASLSLMFARPDLFIDLNRLMCGHLPAVDRLRVALFAQPIDDERLRRYALWAQPESWRALWDMALDLPQPARVLAQLAPSKIKVAGGEDDRLIPAALVRMTADSYHTEAMLYPGLGHALMLEADWRRVADDLRAFLEGLS